MARRRGPLLNMPSGTRDTPLSTQPRRPHRRGGHFTSGPAPRGEAHRPPGPGRRHFRAAGGGGAELGRAGAGDGDGGDGGGGAARGGGAAGAGRGGRARGPLGKRAGAGGPVPGGAAQVSGEEGPPAATWAGGGSSGQREAAGRGRARLGSAPNAVVALGVVGCGLRYERGPRSSGGVPPCSCREVSCFPRGCSCGTRGSPVGTGGGGGCDSSLLLPSFPSGSRGGPGSPLVPLRLWQARGREERFASPSHRLPS